MANREIISVIDLTSKNKCVQKLFDRGLGRDGCVSQDADGLNLDSKVFTTTMPQGPLGRLDYFKLGLTFKPIPINPTGTTFFEACLSGKQHFSHLDPDTSCVITPVCGQTNSVLFPPIFNSRVKNAKADPRLATSGVLMYDPDNDFVTGVLLTDHMIYAVYGILGLQPIEQAVGTGSSSLPKDRKLPFSNTTVLPRDCACTPLVARINRRVHLTLEPLATRESHHPINDFRQIGIGINPGQDSLSWFINGQQTLLHHGIGRPGPIPHRVLNMQAGQTMTSLVPTRFQPILFTGSMLDLAMPDNYMGDHTLDSTSLTNLNQSHLVALECPDQYSNVQASTDGTYAQLDAMAFAAPGDGVQYRLFGQGASMTIKYLAILTSPDTSVNIGQWSPADDTSSWTCGDAYQKDSSSSSDDSDTDTVSTATTMENINIPKKVRDWHKANRR